MLDPMHDRDKATLLRIRQTLGEQVEPLKLRILHTCAAVCAAEPRLALFFLECLYHSPHVALIFSNSTPLLIQTALALAILVAADVLDTVLRVRQREGAESVA